MWPLKRARSSGRDTHLSTAAEEETLFPPHMLLVYKQSSSFLLRVSKFAFKIHVNFEERTGGMILFLSKYLKKLLEYLPMFTKWLQKVDDLKEVFFAKKLQKKLVIDEENETKNVWWWR